MQVIDLLSTRTLLSVIAALMGGGFLVGANMLGFMMVGQVNEKSPPADRASYLWWSMDIRRRHRQMYGVSTLVWWQNVCIAAAVICFAVAILADA